MIELPLTHGLVALIDDEDVRLAAFKWQAVPDCRTYYATRTTQTGSGRPRTLRLHREVLGITDALVAIDHINGNGLDCRRSNLRIVDVTQNNRNARVRSDNTSGFKGVTVASDRATVRAQIRVNGRRVHLGRFRDPKEAARAYDDAARKYHGAFATLNFPGPGERPARPSPRGTGTEAVERVCPACGETPSAARERWAKIAARPDFDPEGAPTPCDHAALRRGTVTEGGK